MVTKFELINVLKMFASWFPLQIGLHRQYKDECEIWSLAPHGDKIWVYKCSNIVRKLISFINKGWYALLENFEIVTRVS